MGSFRSGCSSYGAHDLADGHLATRLETLFPGVDTEDFRGTLTGTVQGSTVAMSVIRLDSSSGRATSMPVKRIY